MRTVSGLSVSVAVWAALAWAASAFLMAMALQYRARLRAALAEQPCAAYTPRATVIVPCKDLDDGFELNVSALLQQDYPDYQVIFATSDEDDPAYSVLQRLVSQHGYHARLVVAGLADGRSQKVHNQLAALRAAGGAEVYVFADSDGHVGPDFCRRLVAPLRDPAVGATTGYRWFVPVRGHILEVLTALWGAIVASVQAAPVFTQLWGGAIAMRRDTFNELGAAQAWAGASTDDDSLTRLLRARGLPIVFVPHCVVLSPMQTSVRSFMAWGMRQLLLTRVYLPAMWWQLLALTAVVALSPIAGLVIAAVGAAGNSRLLAEGLVLAATGAAPAISTAVIARSTEAFLRSLGRPLKPLAWWQFLAATPGTLVLLAHFIHSGVSRRVEWRGVTYDLLAPDRTVIMRRR